MLSAGKNIIFLDLGNVLQFYSKDSKNKLFNQLKEYLNLKTLLLDYNFLSNISNNIWSLDKLEKLSLANNKLISISEDIGILTNLKQLYLQNNLLERLPYTICNLKKLQSLELANNRIIYLPENLNKLTQLKNVSIMYNKLTRIPKNISTNKIWCFDISSYQINNLDLDLDLDLDCDVITIYYLIENIDNLPIGLKELRLYKVIGVPYIKLPFGCNLYIDDVLQ
jgi:Leucine-rich repeat (LRR) protein